MSLVQLGELTSRSLLAKRDPHDPVIERLDHPIVVAHGCGEGGFAVAPGTMKGGGDRHRILVCSVEEQIGSASNSRGRGTNGFGRSGAMNGTRTGCGRSLDRS